MGAGKDFLKPEYVHRVNGRAWDKGPANWQLRTGVALVGILAFVVYPLYRAGARMEQRAVAVESPTWYASSQPVAKERDLSLGETAAE